jgi:hypothetical protein
VRAPIGEIVLFVYGRGYRAAVELVGEPAVVETVRATRFCV